MINFKSLFPFFVCFLVLSPIDILYAEEKDIVGWVEKVKVYPADLMFIAKLDTGARSSSINAKNIEEFERNGELWVRFDVVNRKGTRKTVELPQIREAKIKRHFGKRQHRPVVLLGVCLGKTYQETQVSLVDREGFLYPLLIGRSFIKNAFIVDPSLQYTTQPHCPKPDNNE